MSGSDANSCTGHTGAGPADAAAGPEWMPLVYDELRRVARRAMSGERPGHTLQTTALVNEAFLRLHGQHAPWRDRVHFFAAAATAMRRILVDHARGRARQRRGSGVAPVSLSDAAEAVAVDGPGAAGAVDVLDLDRALAALAQQDTRKARAVELFYFAGLDYDEIAHAEGVSPATAKRDLQFARAWLRTVLA